MIVVELLLPCETLTLDWLRDSEKPGDATSTGMVTWCGVAGGHVKTSCPHAVTVTEYEPLALAVQFKVSDPEVDDDKSTDPVVREQLSPDAGVTATVSPTRSE
jgi:hypothetical protein